MDLTMDDNPFQLAFIDLLLEVMDLLSGIFLSNLLVPLFEGIFSGIIGLFHPEMMM